MISCSIISCDCFMRASGVVVDESMNPLSDVEVKWVSAQHETEASFTNQMGYYWNSSVVRRCSAYRMEFRKENYEVLENIGGDTVVMRATNP